jgi:hypothetical protein
VAGRGRLGKKTCGRSSEAAKVIHGSAMDVLYVIDWISRVYCDGDRFGRSVLVDLLELTRGA